MQVQDGESKRDDMYLGFAPWCHFCLWDKRAQKQQAYYIHGCMDPMSPRNVLSSSQSQTRENGAPEKPEKPSTETQLDLGNGNAATT